ncbi:hypothetical protein [Intestinicryptomonas porci]|uniref:Uncharacterized protein n=1 Tax=Intestinicryptomonas porci TaxID=2926320 RepID=A0ABU4WG62_9BACT|nr:hypothetical protein [Opitutales bacterium CLA-KB-P66]
MKKVLASFMLFTPSMDNGNKSGGMEWVIPETNNNPWTWRLLTKSTEQGTVDDTYTMLNGNVTVVPEPSTYQQSSAHWLQC